MSCRTRAATGTASCTSPGTGASVRTPNARSVQDEQAKLLTIQGGGDYEAAKQLTDQLGAVDAQLAGDLKRLDQAHIPVDIRFEQGLDVLGLKKP